MQLSHLEYLVAVKKYGSMNKAAAALFCTQPTISSAFHTLENELKCKLLERNSSGSSFTKDGERIAADAEVILGIIDSWKQLSASETEILQILSLQALVHQQCKIYSFHIDRSNRR